MKHDRNNWEKHRNTSAIEFDWSHFRPASHLKNISFLLGLLFKYERRWWNRAWSMPILPCPTGFMYELWNERNTCQSHRNWSAIKFVLSHFRSMPYLRNTCFRHFSKWLGYFFRIKRWPQKRGTLWEHVIWSTSHFRTTVPFWEHQVSLRHQVFFFLRIQ